MSRTETETVGMARKLLPVIESLVDQLKAANIDAVAMAADLRQAIEEATEENARQENFKSFLKDSTRKVVHKMRRLDVLTSGDLDIVLGAIGKDTPQAATLRRIRSRVRLSGNGKANSVDTADEDSDETPATTEAPTDQDKS